MSTPATRLREDALKIWQAGVRSVHPSLLIPEYIRVDGNWLSIDNQVVDLQGIERIAVVGAGKAGGAMVTALEESLGPAVLRAKQVFGWVNVPANCIVPTRAVYLHPARPPGRNEPTAAGMAGAIEILNIVRSLGPRDLCLCLISGGGSALLPLPIPGLPLATKVALTRDISARGGNIRQLNSVRRALSQIKGGGLALAARHCRLVTLMLSDVIGDDLEMIASGPTILSAAAPEAAIDVLADLELLDSAAGAHVTQLLASHRHDLRPTPANDRHSNVLIGNNTTALNGAAAEARRLKYTTQVVAAVTPQSSANNEGYWHAEAAVQLRNLSSPRCLISGGEPTVQLASEHRRDTGGRNQQLALAAFTALHDWHDLALLAGGTDGEDGPTDAAGAIVDARTAAIARRHGLDPAAYLRRNDAYNFFRQVDGLIQVGPTNTNVCDIRVICSSGTCSDDRRQMAVASACACGAQSTTPPPAPPAAPPVNHQ